MTQHGKDVCLGSEQKEFLPRRIGEVGVLGQSHGEDAGTLELDRDPDRVGQDGRGGELEGEAELSEFRLEMLRDCWR